MMGYRQTVRRRILIPAFRVRIPVARFTEDEISCELYKTRFCGKLKKTYELCPKCRKDFERFMRNDS